MRIWLLLPAVAAGVLACGPAAAAATVELSVGVHRIEAEVAGTPEERATGLMHRRSLPAHRGMLFVFPAPGLHCFWMKNTLIPLSIAFLDDAGRIVQIADMQPHSLDSHCPPRPVRFALEMNAGWFGRRGLAPGDRILGLEKVSGGR